jgi:hypothetical protein
MTGFLVRLLAAVVLLIITFFTKTGCVRRYYKPIIIMKSTAGMSECKQGVQLKTEQI